jgi:hypothetical protein
MPQKKTTSILRTNLVNVGIGQGMMETLPYLFNRTEYDRKGEITAQSSFTSDGLLAEKMAWEYDETGRVVKQSYFTEPDEPSEVISFERNTKGLVTKDLKKYLDGSVDTTTYEYDDKDRLTRKVTVDEEGITDLQEVFTWNELHLLKHEVFDGENNILAFEEYGYDSNGNITEKHQLNEETGENQRIVSSYNPANQKIKDDIYDEDDELLETTSYVLDKNGRLVSSAYESSARSSASQYFYDDKGNNLGQEEIDEDGNQVLSIEHQYDDQDNRIGSVVFANGGTIASSQHYRLKYEYEWYED